jgi:3-oxoacyl-[acyl-carrier protein] reductase
MDVSPVNVRPVAIVTGASGGIGRACALALARASEPCDILVHYQASASAAEELVLQLQTQCAVRAVASQADFSKAGEAQKLVDQAAAALGAPSILVHCAGHIFEKPIAFTKPEEWDALFDVHVYAAAALCKALAPHLRKSERGRIVLMGSLAGRIGLGNGAAYAAAKGALDGLCKSFALEAARWKTCVNTIAPGYVESHMTAQQDAQRREAAIQGIPLGRYASCEEIASLVAYLCSEPAAYITGQTIVVDGGAGLGEQTLFLPQRALSARRNSKREEGREQPTWEMGK